MSIAATAAAELAPPLRVERAVCCICRIRDAEVVATGHDYEYHTCPDRFAMVRCRGCGLLYLDPRPALSELNRIYPPEYHAFAFTASDFGFVYRVRERLEARRVLSWCTGLPDAARILDIGCGDGFHLRLLKKYGRSGWQVEGVDSDARAVAAAGRAGLTVHHGFVEELPLTAGVYDLILLIMTVEHVADPAALLRTVQRLLRPGGRVIIITDNTASLDAACARGGHWGGYHFPRHWYLFSPDTLRRLGMACGFDVLQVTTVMSPVNWVYSIRNWLVDRGAPTWLYERFSLGSPVSLAAFTAVDLLATLAGRGAIMRGEFQRGAGSA